jgi:hypothetical protein
MADVHRTLFCPAADAPDARAYAQLLAEENDGQSCIIGWFERVRVYAETATQEQIDAGTATIIGYIESGGMPQWLADGFAHLVYEPEPENP